MLIMLDITNNITNDLTSDTNSTSEENDQLILKFVNNYEKTNIINEIINKPLEKDEIIEIKCSIIKFLGSGSYGKVYKIKIKKKYYALKISENEKPLNFKMRYDSLINIEPLKKYIIDTLVVGNIKCGKYNYFSIMEYGGTSLKNKLPLESVDEVEFVLRQLYNIVYLCSKHRICLTDFKLNNIVVDKNCFRLKLIDLYIECAVYSPCKQCKIVKTYSTIEMDKIKNILDDENYTHTYHLIPLGIGLIDLLCKKSASHIILSLANNFNLNLGVKQMIPLIQVACYRHIHNSNKQIKEYIAIYQYKKKIEKKYDVIKYPEFYKTFMDLIEIKDNYKNKISSNKLKIILHHLFSACPDDRSLEPLKNYLTTI